MKLAGVGPRFFFFHFIKTSDLRESWTMEIMEGLKAKERYNRYLQKKEKDRS